MIPPPKPWSPVKQIPVSDKLYRRITFRHAAGDSIKPDAFYFNSTEKNESDPGISVDWSEYSSTDKCRDKQKFPVWYYGVATIPVGRLSEIPKQELRHVPVELEDNYAHSQIHGPKEALHVQKYCEIAKQNDIIFPRAFAYRLVPLKVLNDLKQELASSDVLMNLASPIHFYSDLQRLRLKLPSLSATSEFRIIKVDFGRVQGAFQLDVENIEDEILISMTLRNSGTPLMLRRAIADELAI